MVFIILVTFELLYRFLSYTDSFFPVTILCFNAKEINLVVSSIEISDKSIALEEGLEINVLLAFIHSNKKHIGMFALGEANRRSLLLLT